MAGPAWWSVVARLPVYLMSLAMVLLVREQGGSYAQSGTVAAAYTVCMAVGSPLIARRADRAGPRAVLIGTGLVHPSALAVLVWATEPGGWAQPAMAGLAGLALPPANSVMRSLWARLPLADDERQLAYLWEALLTEVLVIGAPLLLAGLMLAGSAGLALTAAAVTGGAGALGLAFTRAAAGGVRPAPADADDAPAPGVLGPLRNPALLALTAIMATCAVPIGLMTLAIPAFVDAHGARAGTGLVYACWGVGSALGALCLGRAQSEVAVHRRFPRQVLGYALGTALPLLATSEGTLAVALALGSAPIALVSASEMTLVGAVAEERLLTEAFTWASLATVTGDALGQQMGGLLMAPLGPHGVFGAAFAVALAGAALAFACRGLLARGTRPVPAEAVA
ncbi:MFS transporter [Streptomyces sp. NPDC057579]|uniref:MFS transporter n=1 Tax=unclassified Streptomyces TaxID=2593676 RepID=UPI0036A8E302